MPARATTQQRHRAELNQDEQDVLYGFNSQTFLDNYAKNVMVSSPGTQTKLLQKAEAQCLSLLNLVPGLAAVYLVNLVDLLVPVPTNMVQLQLVGAMSGVY